MLEETRLDSARLGERRGDFLESAQRVVETHASSREYKVTLETLRWLHCGDNRVLSVVIHKIVNLCRGVETLRRDLINGLSPMQFIDFR